ELARGAENLQVEFGYSRSGPVGDGQSVESDDWLSADEVPGLGWEQILSLRIGIVMRSTAMIDGTRPEQTFELARTNVTPQADGRLRQSFSSTVALRNRILVMGGS
ncbi:MAG: PilW family protein, partial [Wenzhouxiangellaceae bacterium]|nr:PilW family protein [Wenzhouxiangellaceae bacterium]